MAFTLETWKTKISERLQTWGTNLKPETSSVYAALCTTVLWPVVQAANTGEMWPALATLGASVGGNLLANVIQGWKDETEATQQLAEIVGEDSPLRAELDALLEKFDVFTQASRGLRETDRQWFADTLREELTQLGNLPRFEAHLQGSGAIAQGKKSAAAGKRAVANTGKIDNSVIVTGDRVTVYNGPPTRDPAEALALYRRVLADSCRHLSLRGLDIGASDPTGTPQQFDLAQIYVELLTTTQVPKEKGRAWEREQRGLLGERELRTLSVLEAVIAHRNMVVLGDPGSGKSTFLSHLALCLAAQGGGGQNDRSTRLEGWPMIELDTLPILVTLREFARWLPSCYRKAEPQHLWEFLTERLEAQNLGFAVEPLHERLDSGQVILLFDGLDEIPTQQQRSFVRDEVLTFARRYSRCRLVVTCRTLSYQDSAVRLADAQEFTLAPFTEEQIDHFIVAWYGELVRMRSIKPEARAGMTQRLQEAVRRPDLQRLSSNPLLLSAMALVHAHKGQLPDARALLYEETIDILLWRWDQLKTEGKDEPPRLRTLLTDVGRAEADLKRALWQLAFVAHEKGGTGDGETVADIGEAQLEKALSQLHPHQSKDWAGQVIEVMKLRAGLLLERAPEVYTFPHRTFQEYLAGAYLASQPDFAQRAARLAAASALWREVILLAVGRLVYRDADTDKPLALVAELCPAKRDGTDVAWRQTWLAGDALVEMGLNRANDRALGRELLDRVSHGLVDLLQGSHLSPVERARAGDTLAQLGDPRFRADAWYLPDEPLLGFVEIPAGSFLMGEGKEQHAVSLSQYYIARYPVTLAQFRAFMEDKQEQPSSRRSLDGFANHPAIAVTWHEALAYCQWLTKELYTGRKVPAAVAQQAREEGWVVTLPSEAEWEKAARGTTGLIYPWGNEWKEDRANTDEAGIRCPSAVGCFPQGASPYECVDMVGNVLEWTRSLWGKDLMKPEFIYPYDPTDKKREDLTESDNVYRVLRGGSFLYLRDVRCASRDREAPSLNYGYVGFRVVVRPKGRP
ncbi:MAG: SUMF1/EgtB/PvdO family nonheme iron enzyme [Deltaproteobacteria bacterium]|nr:SUMF1/EgtB/PvdO family nonheme iron enzyme [Deltaproteobacteria bacterium]